MTRCKEIIIAMLLAITLIFVIVAFESNNEAVKSEKNVHAQNITEQSEAESTAEETTQTTLVSTTEEKRTTTIKSETTAVETTCYIPIEELQIDFDMDVSKPTGLSKEDFVYLISSIPCDYCGYFKRNSDVFWEACNEMGVNEIFACAITAWESDWGRIAGWGQNNYFGIAGGNYQTEAEGIRALVTLLANDYLDESGSYYNGKTITGVSYYYCEPEEWPYRVYEDMCTIVSGS